MVQVNSSYGQVLILLGQRAGQSGLSMIRSSVGLRAKYNIAGHWGQGLVLSFPFIPSHVDGLLLLPLKD